MDFLFSSTDELDAMDGPMDIYTGPGQPLDHEPSMGQVPVIPPGTPPSENWANYNGLPPNSPYFGRRSPNLPMSQQQMMPSDCHQLVGGPMGRVLPSDVSDSDQSYSEYPPGTTPNHVEVY